MGLAASRHSGLVPQRSRAASWTGNAAAARWRCAARHSSRQYFSSSVEKPSSDSVPLGLRNPIAVDEAAVQRLVDSHTTQRGQQQGQAASKVAAWARLLLQLGLSEQEVAAGLGAKGCSGGLGRDAASILQLLLDAGLSPSQIASCLWCVGVLGGSARQKAASIGWLRANLRCSRQELICKAPGLLKYSVEALDKRLCWWEGLAGTATQLNTVRRKLRIKPSLLAFKTDSLQRRMQDMADAFGVTEAEIGSRIIYSMEVLGVSFEDNIAPKTDFLLQLLLGDDIADPEKQQQTRRRIFNNLDVLKLSVESLAASAEAVEELFGSKAAAQGVMQRGIFIFISGSTNIRRNWQTLRVLIGGDAAAAAKAVKNCTRLLALDLRLAVFQQRLCFYQLQCGAGPERVLRSYIKASLSNVAPRLAWAELHRTDIAALGPKLVGPLSRPDAECMRKLGVPLEGYPWFKEAWLASEEGREWCKFEAGGSAAAAGRMVAEGWGGGDPSSDDEA